MMSDDYKDILRQFPARKIAVVGDCMIDRFLWGSVERISPEAPVPVVRLQSETAKLGGAANVASNLRALGTQVTLVAVCGRDESAAKLRTLLRERQIADDGLVEVPQRPTTIKTRIIASFARHRTSGSMS